MTEDEIRQCIRNSQKDGFLALFRQYQSYVYSIVWGRIRTVGTAEDAEECVSDVFAEVFLHYDDIHPGSMQAYIGTVAKRTAVHRYRSLRAQDDITAEDQTDDLADMLNIEAEYESKERSKRLHAAVQSLGKPDSTIIIQRYFYDRNATDIAKALDMTPVAVRVRLSRALKRLRALLDEPSE